MPRMSRCFRSFLGLLSCLAAAATLTVSAAPGAGAETYRHRDATRDVWHVDQFDDHSMARSDRVGDIQRFRARLGSRKLVLRVSYREIRSTGREVQYWFFKGVPGIYGVEYSMKDKSVMIYDEMGFYPVCQGSSVVINTVKDLSIAKIPVTCLNSPARIKVTPLFRAWYAPSGPLYQSFDMGTFNGYPGDRTKYSPWIAAG